MLEFFSNRNPGENMAAPSTIGQVRDVFPKLGELTDEVEERGA